MANTDIGTFVTQVLLLSSVGWGATSLLQLSHLLPKIASQFKNFGAVISLVAEGSASLADSLKLAGNGASILSGVFSSSLPIILGVSAAIVGVISAIKAYKEANPTIEEANNKIEEFNNSLKENQDRIKEINSLDWTDKTSELITEKELLEKQNKELEEQIELYKQLSQEAASKILSGSQTVYKGVTYRTNAEGIGLVNEFSSYDELEKKLLDLGYTAEEAAEKIYEIGDYASLSGTNLENEYIRILNDLTDELENENKLSDESIALRDKNIDNINEYIQALKTQGNIQPGSVEEKLIDAYENYNNAVDKAIDVTKFLTENLQLSEAQVNKLKGTYPQLSSTISTSNGVIGLNIEKLGELEGQTIETIVEMANLIAQETVFNNSTLNVNQKLNALASLAATAGATIDVLNVLNGTTDYETIIKRYGSLQNYYNFVMTLAKNKVGVSSTDNDDKGNIIVPGGGSGTVGSSTTKTDKALEEFNSFYKDLQHLRDMDEIDEQEYYDQLKILVENYTKDATKNMEEYGLDRKTIAQNMYQYEEEIYEGLKKLEEERIENLKEIASVYESLFSYMTNQIDKEINKLQEERDSVAEVWDERIAALEEENEAIERQIQLEQLQNNLAKARQNKLLLYKDGRFQYVEDIDEISQAQVDLEEYEREESLRQEVENLEQLKDQALSSIDAQIKGWEDYKEEWSSVVDSYEEEQDRLLIEQQLGISLEGENWKQRLSNLQEFVTAYKALMAEITAAQNLGAGSNSSSSNSIVGSYGGYGSRDEYENVVQEAFEQSSSSGNRVDLGNGVYVDASKANSYASGSLNTKKGISLVGENGPELRFLNNGESILPTNISENLLSWGKYNPLDFISNLSLLQNKSDSSNAIYIDNLNLPEVKNGIEFVEYMKNNFWRKTVQFQTT